MLRDSLLKNLIVVINQLRQSRFDLEIVRLIRVDSLVYKKLDPLRRVELVRPVFADDMLNQPIAKLEDLKGE